MEEYSSNYYTVDNKNPDYKGDDSTYEAPFEKTCADIPAKELNYFGDSKPEGNPVFGIISFVCAMVSIVFSGFCCCISPLIAIPVGIITGIAGIALFIVDKKINGSASKLALAGFIISIISVSLSLLIGVIYIIYFIVVFAVNFFMNI
ncbi:MAG: hypothetical protein IJ437_06365 [Clostridia bacterium]|nr:hypothetical protein [Clostridia bacterium]